MEQIRSIKIVVEIDTNKQTHKEEFNGLDPGSIEKAKSFIDTVVDALNPFDNEEEDIEDDRCGVCGQDKDECNWRTCR